ncbi:hypothetical protein [Pseudoalteromonas piratica]|uniref:Uncharacterized protein n=1 Tax=Pseudoalteromonas piratica TaxID=1348114 RepID=A0A0A7EFW4_9GAMM|nr:hypothetical protein [Pseudoalteromonas piratica]AIY65443.1 hypothetical protein OM33_10000 [Pseudoalteromonas piratica]
MSLISEPIGWSRSIAKSKSRVILFTAMHFAVLLLAIWLLFEKVSVQQPLSTLSFQDFLISSSLILFIGGFYPCLYLYAIYRLLEINKLTSDN